MTRYLTTALVVSMLAIAGCGDDDEATTPAAKQPAASTDAGTEALYGLYVRTVTKADLARTDDHRSEYGPQQHLPPTGRYQLVLAKGAGQDVMKVTDPDDFTTDMDITVEPDVLKATTYVDPSRGAFCGPEVAAQATYAYDASGDTLKLTPRADQCADRDSMLTGTWKRG
jgi:hypothetical protein